MRCALVVAILGIAVPAVAVGQGLGPRTLLPMHVACADLPISAPPAVSLTVAASRDGDGRQTLATGDVVVIRAGAPQGLTVGQQFLARRLDGGREAFRRGREGFAGVRTAGVLTVTAVDERFALARIDRACDGVEVGDYLEPLSLPSIPTPAGMGAPRFEDRAVVLFGADLRATFGDGDVVAINRGTAHGVAPGTRIALFRDSGEGLPLSELGEAVVIEAGDAASRAVLVRVRDVVTSGDVVVVRASSQP